jgi:protein phosphatase
VGAAARSTTAAESAALKAASVRSIDVDGLLEVATNLERDIGGYIEAYRRYAPGVTGVEDVRVAPFQLLAGAGSTFVTRPHDWHMTMADRLAEADPELLVRTRNVSVDVTDPAQQEAATAWWQDLTEASGEGMVVKPMTPIGRGRHGLIPPGIKVRGREYLRIIYGPTYTEPENLQRLRERKLGRKRSLASREFALGIEALERWTRGEPLHRVHECVFAVLALESEPVDPRL